MRNWLASLLLLVVMMLGEAARAHLTPNSEINLDFGATMVRADVIIPIGDYAAASGNAVDELPRSLERAADFLRQQVSVVTPSGEPWQMAIERVEFVRIAGPPDLHATLTLRPPPGRSTRTFAIEWRAVVDQVPGHFALFVARRDFAAGTLSGQREILGAARADRMTLSIDLGVASPWAGFAAALALGAHHIAEGHDHLLFLIALLIPAPLLARGGRWTDPLPPSRAFWRLAGIVTAFTIGHSITLLGGVFLGWHLPERPVEIAIAASILVSAIHAWRPIFPGREAWIAGSFGLVHGLAFATLAGGLGLDLTERVLATLGFNLGIELFQLLVLAAVMPLLFMLAVRRSYAPLRTVIAGFAGLAALAWMVERITGQSNKIAALTDLVLAYSVWPVAIVTVAAVTASLRSKVSNGVSRVAD